MLKAGADAGQPVMRGAPFVFRDNPKCWSINSEPFLDGSLLLVVLTPPIPLAGAIPNDLASIERPMQDFVDGRGSPPGRTMLLRSRCGRALLVEQLRNARVAVPGRAQTKDRSDHVRLGLVDPPLGVALFAAACLPRSTRAAARRTNVVVGEDAATCDLPRPSLSQHRVVRALPCLLSFELVCECREGKHDLVGRAVECALTIFEVEEHPYASSHELLQRVRGLDGFSAESRLLAHDEHLK